MRHSLLSLGLLLLLPSIGHAQRGAQECTLTGRGELPHVHVAPPGADAFDLHLTGGLRLEVRAQPGGRARVRTRGLVLEGTVGTGDVPLAVARETRVNGVLTLRPGTAIAPVDLLARRVSVELERGVRVASLVLPCAAMTVAATADAPEARPPGAPAEGSLLSLGDRLRVYERPGIGATVIEAIELRLAELERRAGWVRVRHDFVRGSTLRGWVREADVRSVPAAPFDRIGDNFDFGGLGLCGHGASHAYMGPATLVRGGEIRTARDGAVWARAEEDVPLATVEIVWDDGWAQVVSVEGIHDYEGCEHELDSAWVAVTSLRFPPGARGVHAGSPAPP